MLLCILRSEELIYAQISLVEARRRYLQCEDYVIVREHEACMGTRHTGC
jgi:hypothetical protein